MIAPTDFSCEPRGTLWVLTARERTARKRRRTRVRLSERLGGDT
jgi:hypothetical protein